MATTVSNGTAVSSANADASNPPAMKQPVGKESSKSFSSKSFVRPVQGSLGPTVNRVLANIFTQPLDTISVNPFVNHWKPSRLELLRVWTIGLLMVVIRAVPMALCILFSCLLAKVFLWVISLLNRLSINSEPFRQLARDICFLIMRTGLLFAGFYWIRVIDKRRDKSRLAPIITVAPHSSFFDIIVILKLKRPTFVSKAENQDAPLIGNLLRLCKGIYVDRADKNSRHNTVQEIRNRANNGEHVLIFPEGTCANRTSLVQFKMGAFIPKLPVQPIIVRWDAGETMDSVTWTWEGPGPGRIFLGCLTRCSTNCEITILPEYTPNNEEKANAQLFAENVSRVMCTDLGVLMSYYSFDDVPLMPAAKFIRLFRSPACISFLKMCYRIYQKKNDPNEAKKESASKQPCAQVNRNKARTPTPVTLIASGNATSLGVGEDIEHHSTTSEVYVTKNFICSEESLNPQKMQFKLILKTDDLLHYRVDQPPPTVKSSQAKEPEEFQYLPISGARRRIFKPSTSAPPIELSAQEKKSRRILEIFSLFIEHCITHLETNFEFRVIESSDDVISLIGLQEYINCDDILDSLQLSSLFMDTLKIIEYSVTSPVTTVHLLAILHLCDIREHDMWARIENVVRLFDMAREATKAVKLNSSQKNKLTKVLAPARSVAPKLLAPIRPWLNLAELHTLLWYSLGLQEFNDQFFLEAQFDLEHLRANLTRTFHRATVENAIQLLDSIN